MSKIPVMSSSVIKLPFILNNKHKLNTVFLSNTLLVHHKLEVHVLYKSNNVMCNAFQDLLRNKQFTLFLFTESVINRAIRNIF